MLDFYINTTVVKAEGKGVINQEVVSPKKQVKLDKENEVAGSGTSASWLHKYATWINTVLTFISIFSSFAAM